MRHQHKMTDEGSASSPLREINTNTKGETFAKNRSCYLKRWDNIKNDVRFVRLPTGWAVVFHCTVYKSIFRHLYKKSVF